MIDTSDTIINNGTLKIGSSSLEVGKRYKIFEGTANGDLFNESGKYSFTNSDGTGYILDNQGFLTIVPEPSTYAAIFGAVALAFAAYRRRK